MAISSELLEMIEGAKQEGKVNGSGNGLRSPDSGDSGPQGPNSGGASARTQDSTSNQEEDVEDPVQRLLEHLEANDLDTFHDESGRPYMTVNTSKGRRTFAVRSKAARDLLQGVVWNEWQDPLSKYKMEDAMQMLASKAKYEGEEKETFLRIGHRDQKVYLDLANDQGEVVEISRDGWQILAKSPVPFLKTDSMKPLPHPKRGG